MNAAAAPNDAEVLWRPPADVLETSELGRYLDWLAEHRGQRFVDYPSLWAWSVEDLDGFWGSIWDHFGVAGGRRAPVALAERRMPGARWFPDSTLNYAEEALRRGADDDLAVIARVQGEADRTLTWGELREQVGRCQAGLLRAGVGRGDAVGAYLGNRVEALVAFLAAAALGASWASCPPEFGVAGAVGRLGQLAPKVLVAQAGYQYGAKTIDRNADLAEIVAALPGAPTVVLVELEAVATPREVPGAGDVLSWGALLAEAREVTFEPVPFDHPLYVLFSSGTTGPPKAIVHGHGGIVVEHLKALSLHLDLGPSDRFFWFSTTGWMMWNFLVSGLLVGATIALFDGDPGADDLDALWSFAEEHRLTYFGTSAPFLLACRDRGLAPGTAHDLSALRGVGSTGAPLPPEGFRWVYSHVHPTALLSSISGGTDVCTAFVGASPLLPVYAGRLPCALLGAKVEAFDPEGRAVVGESGELVITEPLPSMPVGFLHDADGSRYRAAYFEDRSGVWTHGDWVTFGEDGSCVITGRSDATLNRGGVRLGTSELYSVVEDQPEVADSLVVHLEDPDGGPGDLLLFVVPSAEGAITPEVEQRLVRTLRTRLSPRHAPDQIHQVAGIPRTRSGKKLEVPVKAILQGKPVDVVVGADAVSDASLLDAFAALAAQRNDRSELS